MRLPILGLSAVLLAASGPGCSSKSSLHDDGGLVGEAGAIDGASKKDGRGSADTRDAVGIDLSANEAGVARDTKTTALDTASRDTSDSRILGSDVAGKETGNRDSGPDTRSDAAPDGVGDAGSTTIPAQASGTCASPIDIPYLSSIDLTADTTNADHILDFPCVSNGADIVFRIRTDGTEMVYADTFGTDWDTALLFSESCQDAEPPDDNGMTTCNDDACESYQSQAFATFRYGYHYLIVSGVNGGNGPLRLHFEHAMLGNGPPSNLPAGTSTVDGTTSGFDSSRTCDLAGPKTSYWWTTCPGDIGGAFSATTCNGADWDTALILQIPRLGDNGVTCDDDDATCGIQATVDATIPDGAGMAVLSVTGNLMRNYGDYKLTYTRP